MSDKTSVLLLFAAALSLPLPALATTLYVAPTGSDSNSGSQAAPFATIAAAAGHAKPGDSVAVEPGTYAGGFTTSARGNAAAPVSYFSVVPGAAKIVGTGSGDQVWWNKGSYVRIEGFDISGPAYRIGLYGSGSYTTFDGNTVHDVLTDAEAFASATAAHNGGAGIEQDGYAGGVGGSVANNTVFRIGPSGQKSSLLAGIYQTEPQTSVVDNDVSDTAGTGIGTWHGARDITITGNAITDARSGGIFIGSGDSGSSASTGGNFTVTGNTISGSPSGVSEGGALRSGNVVTDNTVVSGAGAAEAPAYTVLPTTTPGDKPLPLPPSSTPAAPALPAPSFLPESQPVSAPVPQADTTPPPAPVTADPSIPRTIGTSAGCGASVGAGTGQFEVRGGRIIDPKGNVFIAKGLNAPEFADPSAILNFFPGVNFVRLAVPDRPSVSGVQNIVSGLTSHGVVVEIEDHPWPELDAASGADLATETNWYASLAAAFKGNPYVWFGTMNEPQGGNIAAQQVATYNAIRATGSNTIIMMEAGLGGGNPGQVGAGALPAASYAGMRNVVWDLHNYGWLDGGSTDQTAMNSAVLGSASGGAGILGANTIQSADGAIPVIIGEFGPACCNVGTVNGDEVINSTIWAVQQGYAQGFAGWGWNTPDEDSLTNGGGSLTSWGNVLSMAVASSCQQLAPGIAFNATPSEQTAGSSAVFVSTEATPAPAASPLEDTGNMPELAPADVSQSFQQGTQDATSTVDAAASAVDAAAKARMQ